MPSACLSGHQAFPIFRAISSALSWMKMAESGFDLLILLETTLSDSASSSIPAPSGFWRPARRWWCTATGTFHPRDGKTSLTKTCTFLWSIPLCAMSRSIALMSVACIGG